ncbi:MAG: tetratricopeptide repeat protein [Anaerolineae bacterium]|nr:tetratricopeptide repeat protein [Anaerolineae bacterium]
MDATQTFGQWLRHRRRELDLTQDTLARQVGCARITIRKLEGDKLRPSMQLANLLMEGLEIPLEEREKYTRFARGGSFPSPPPLKENPNNIPNAISSFVGREHELADVKKLLKASRLVTLTGAGGIGKTRFAMQVGSEMIDSFKDGIWWVELAALNDPALVTGALAKALDVREIPNQSLEETLAHFLRTKQLLLILDNCEHLIEACAQIAGQLLTACKNVKILATSREALGIIGEIVWQVSPLTLPGIQPLSLIESFMQYEATLLFVQRATAVNQYFSLTAQNVPAVFQICRYLEGIPLAIELAAARVKTLSPEQIATRMDDRFALLISDGRTAPSRQQTLRATLDWSHDLLTETERELFRQLSIFAGGFTLGALESIARLDSNLSVLDMLSRVVDKSLIVVEQKDHARYRLLETIRQYALEKLEGSGEAKPIHDRHLDYFLMFAEQAEAHLFRSEQRDWARRLEVEHDNLRAAITWSFECNQIQTGLQMAGALAWFWHTNGHLTEGSRWLEKMLTSDQGTHGRERAKALRASSILARDMGDYVRARAFAESSIRLYREFGEDQGTGLALADLGATLSYEGKREEAIESLQESLHLLQPIGEWWGTAYAHLWLGDTLFRLGDTTRAATNWEESLRLTQELGDYALMAWSLSGLADVARLRGDYKRAIGMFKEALALYRDIGTMLEPPWTLEALGLVAAALGEAQHAARLWGAASAWREAINEALPLTYQRDYAASIAQACTQLGEKAYASAWSEGRAMSPEQAIEFALEESND